MLDHVSIGVRDLAASKRFYDAILAPLGFRCLKEVEGGAGYGSDYAYFWLSASKRPVPADPESGLHFCFKAPDREAVEKFHAVGLANGGSDNGKPGLRPEYHAGYYASFIIDPDGYRIEAYVGV